MYSNVASSAGSLWPRAVPAASPQCDARFSSSVNSECFVISFLISSLTHRFFRRVFGFRVSGDFPSGFLSDSTPLRFI